ncbi:hypothetical protein T552_01763 [Pneumocystis carinii B80]|uniref:Mitochondrial chaperone BCS1 n=1 Tax=Pneumocystis carinii (strain B80) TaxID=1408658 RepID=A0A0W4ZJH0_PNEC8|nr:hypothetical protein T552_01763 [Pneumocystis carinii B80]KTW28504.1 hypothetical protein T552_01763 [Pneumocystis carinii B80]
MTESTINVENDNLIIDEKVKLTKKNNIVASIFNENQFFTAGLGLMGLGTGLALFRHGIIQSMHLAKRYFTVSLEISSKDKSYLWVLHWISSQKLTKRMHQYSVETMYKQHDNGSSSTTFSLIPGHGKHFFKYKDAWIQFYRERDGKMIDLSTGSPWETITLTTLFEDRKIFTELLEDAQNLAMKIQQGKTVIYTSWGSEWRPFGQPRRRRILESVILDKDVKEQIINDIKDFLNSGDWYLQRGIPYRRGYLFYGPPGTGKTSFIQSIAGKLEYNICLLNLSEKGLTDDRLNFLLSSVPTRSIILLEDVDSAFSKREQAEKYGNNITFSGFLNALDGVASAEDRIIFMTTNHLDQLDSALIRPGRVDVLKYFGFATDYQIQTMFLKFYENKNKEANIFLEKVRATGVPVSTAALQGLFIYSKGDPQRAIEMIHILNEIS